MTELERVDGEVIAPNFDTTKPKMEIMHESLVERKNNPPEMQYILMKQYYKDNTDVEKFLSSGEVSDLIAAVSFYRRPSDPNQWMLAKKFVSRYELQGAVDAYFELMYQAAVQGTELIPDVEHLLCFLGITKDYVRRWKTTNPQYSEVMTEAYDRILAIKKQLAMHNKIPSLVYLSDIQNNHGYVSKDKAREEVVTDHEIPNIAELIEGAKLLPG